MADSRRPRSRATRCIAVAALALAVAGCGAFRPTTYSIRYPADGFSGPSTDAGLPIDVIDMTGLVTGVAPGTPRPGSFHADARVEVQGSTIHVSWLGGACESKTRVVVGEYQGGYGLRLSNEYPLAYSCPGVGIFRAIDITLREPVLSKPVVGWGPLDLPDPATMGS